MEISSERYWWEDFRGGAFDLYIPLTEWIFSSYRGLANPVWRNATRGHLGVYRRLWWKRNYYQTKTGKKRSLTLLCNRYVYSSHLDQSFFLLHSFETASWTNFRRTFGCTLRLLGKEEISPDKNWREAVGETAVWCVHSTQGVIPLFSWDSVSTLFL